MHLEDRHARHRGDQAQLAPDRRLLVSARRHADRRALSNRRAARRALASRSRRRALSRTRLMTPADAKVAIRKAALDLGFDAVGFARPDLAASARRDLSEFLARGYHGDMGWLAARAAERGDPKTLWPEVRSVIVLGLNYAPENDALDGLNAPAQGNIS